LKSILELNQFLKDNEKDITKLHITFLSKSAQNQYLQSIEKGSYLPDEYFIKERVIYLYCPNGYGITKLNTNFFENKLKVGATTRNLKTLFELLKIGETIENKL